MSTHDVIEIAPRRIGDVPRTGRILEVLGTPGNRRYRVRWDDGRESVFYPGGDARIRVADEAGTEPGPAEAPTSSAAAA